MHRIAEIISGIGLLIGIYLVLSKSSATTSIIAQLGSSGTGVIKTLQGR